MKLFKKITFLLLLLTFIECAIVTRDGDDIQIFELNTTATLKWNLNGVTDGTSSTVYRVYYNDSGKAFLQTPDITNTFSKALAIEKNDPFNGRVSGTITLNNGNGVLSVELQNVEYEDSGNFTFELFSVTNGNPPTIIQKEVDITLDVQGGPSKCGDQDLPKNFTCSKGDEISGSVTLCGKPRPNLSWTIGDQSINGTIDSTKADQHQYTYSFKHNVTSECGESVSYQATGFQNNKVSGSALIQMDKSEGGGDGGSEGLSGGAIAGIIIGVLVLVVLVALVVLYRLGKIGGGSVAATSGKSPNEQTAMKNENQKV